MKKTLLVLAGLIAAMPVMAQNYEDFSQVGALAGLFMAYGVFVFIAAIAYYIVAAFGIMKLAKNLISLIRGWLGFRFSIFGFYCKSPAFSGGGF